MHPNVEPCHFQCHGLDQHGIDRGLINAVTEHYPVGIYAVADGQGKWLRDQLLAAGLRIPEDVGLLGTGDNLMTCCAREPYLSSIAFPWLLIEQEAARTIHHLINHGQLPNLNTLRPYRVIGRESSQARNPTDPLIAQAVKWMEQHLTCSDPLATTATAMGVSVGTLCLRFKKDLGRSPRKHHEYLRIIRATRLLTDSDLSIAEIAKLSGFRDPNYFAVCFKRLRGCTPTELLMR